MRAILFTFLLACTLTAQAKDADSALTQDIRKFLKLTHVAELSFADIQNNIELQSRANPDVPAAFWKELSAKLNPQDFIERMVPIYEKHFSHEEIKAWIAFFESPHGRSFLKSQITVLKECAAAGQAYVEEVAAPLLKKHEKK
ncbi:DUF2059 domain-containing protein [Prosthecobacter sp.]|uniref:DUF2059 domain-containing protein n=1 Tax=Prosthecobacter sp. TaxID=1965333 RepID=UPI003784DD4F